MQELKFCQSDFHKIHHSITVHKEIINQELSVKEDYWIRTLNTAYPFGLNDRIKGLEDMNKLDLIDQEHPFIINKPAIIDDLEVMGIESPANPDNVRTLILKI